RHTRFSRDWSSDGALPIYSGAQLRGAVVHVYWKDQQAEVFLDTSGETLAKHGYRKNPGKAPMLESLATATLMASQWDMQSPFIKIGRASCRERVEVSVVGV